MRAAAVILALYAMACGRIGFGATTDGGVADARDAIDAATVLHTTSLVTPSTTGAADVFGYSVALSADGTTLAVGAYGEQSSATGINGNAGDNSANQAGAVFIFHRSGTAWVQDSYLKASNTGAADVFGFSIAISADGNTLVVGAPDEDSAATTINGNGNDNSADSAGAAYVFARSGSTWSQQAYLKPLNMDVGDNFGAAVAVAGDGNTVAVGAFTEDGNGGAAVPDPFSNGTSDSGAVYMFLRTGTTWSASQYLKASNTGANDGFGIQVALSGDGKRLAVAATHEASGAVGINGNQLDNTQPQSGAVYMFSRLGNAWSQEAYVKASNTEGGDFFGTALALSQDGSTLVVGAPGEDGSSTGVGGPQVEGAGQAGAAYVFDRAGTTWSQTTYLKATNTDAGDQFGLSVALSSDGATLVVGAPLEDSAQTGTGATGADNSAPDSGAAYAYRRTAGAWAPLIYLKATNTMVGDQFGIAVTVTATGSAIAVGAFNANGSAGAVYTYE